MGPGSMITVTQQGVTVGQMPRLVGLGTVSYQTLVKRCVEGIIYLSSIGKRALVHPC